jgi:hypothetical protein
MLDQIAVADACGGDMLQEAAHDFELVIAGKDQGLLGQWVGGFAFEQDEVLDDAGEAVLGEDVFPEIGGFVAVGVGRVAFALVVALVEGEEDGGRSGEFGGHEDFVGVHGEMDQGATELEQGLGGVALGAVLFLAVVAGGLAGPGVFEFDGDER